MIIQLIAVARWMIDEVYHPASHACSSAVRVAYARPPSCGLSDVGHHWAVLDFLGWLAGSIPLGNAVESVTVEAISNPRIPILIQNKQDILTYHQVRSKFLGSIGIEFVHYCPRIRSGSSCDRPASIVCNSIR